MKNTKTRKTPMLIAGICLIATAINVCALLAWRSNTNPRESPASSQASEISFSEFEFDTVDRVEIKDLHTGEKTTVVGETQIDEISDFLKRVNGADRASSKGYYGGIYDIQMFSSQAEMFGIGFGDDAHFNFGENYEDSGVNFRYPNRYALVGITKEEIQNEFGKYFADETRTR